jgi:EAL domain-containing protein (putative c-di-GMP-specific phosphodiesterase class I)
VQALRDQGLDVVADGCDAQAEWELALQAGCRRAQGALVGAAIAPGGLAAWLQSRSGVA